MPPQSIRVALYGLSIWLGFFAGWAVASIPMTLACVSFANLWIAACAGAAGAVGAFFLVRSKFIDVLLQPGGLSAPLPLQLNRTGLVSGAGLVAFAAAALFFIPTKNAVPLWLVALVLAASGLLMRPRFHSKVLEGQSPASHAGFGLILLTSGTVLLYLIILRPDADDSFYLNLPIGLVSNNQCMMAADTMYAAANWPILGSNYRVEVLPTLTAAIAWGSGLSVVTVAHLVLPVIWCVAWVSTLAVIGHGIFGSRWWVFAVLAVLASMVLAGTLQTWGVHGVARLFHGKAPLMLILVPLTIYVVVRADAAGLGFAPTVAALTGIQCAALGLTANAIYLAPLVLGLALLAGIIERKGDQWQRGGLVVAAAPLVAAGLWLLYFDKPVRVTSVGPQTALALWDMAGTKATLALLFALIAAASLAVRVTLQGRWITAFLVVILALLINPFLWPLYDRFVTGGLNFRLWWAVPAPLFLALALSWLIIQSGWIRIGTFAAGALLALCSLLPSGLIGMQGTSIAPAIAKLPPDEAFVASSLRREVPAGRTVLAVEDIAHLIPVFEGYPAAVYTRRLYLEHSETVVTPDRLAPRRLLADWINGAREADVDDIVAAARQLNVGLVVLRSGNVPSQAEKVLALLGAERIADSKGYAIYVSRGG